MTIPNEVAAPRKPAGVIETHHTNGPTEWGYSFTSHNPEPADYVRCYDEESAWKLARLIESAHAPPAVPVESLGRDADDIPTIDLGELAWEQIRDAAKASPWMPAEYFMNDWVSDVCTFLRDGPAAFMPETAPPPASVPDGWAPTDEQFRAWCETHDMQENVSREAFDDAASLYLITTPEPRT